MAWLLRDGQVLASLDIAGSFTERVEGLLKRRELDVAVLLRHKRIAHAIGLHFPVDVAFLDRDLLVTRTRRLKPYRVARPSLSARNVLVAGEGAFERWSLKAGDRLEIKE
ncbi:MAG: DUF192 domain-containing protein [Actinomycetota bacterium]|nr:DUF192 domain-containing protein [Actinomycetota bacterium]